MSDLIGKICDCVELDEPVVPYRRILAGTTEWESLMTDEWTRQPDNAANMLRDETAPNWRDEDVYLVAFADGQRHIVTKENLWTENELALFKARKRGTCCCPVQCVSERA